ncbi:UNVERIFIED_CONTAM: hypothetical protein H355_003902, partial [Colinus virginianus]
ISFPQKLWAVVESDEFKSIWWGLSRSCSVIDGEMFEVEVLGRRGSLSIFDTEGMKSFVHQLEHHGLTELNLSAKDLPHHLSFWQRKEHLLLMARYVSCCTRDPALTVFWYFRGGVPLQPILQERFSTASGALQPMRCLEEMSPGCSCPAGRPEQELPAQQGQCTSYPSIRWQLIGPPSPPEFLAEEGASAAHGKVVSHYNPYFKRGSPQPLEHCNPCVAWKR